MAWLVPVICDSAYFGLIAIPSHICLQRLYFEAAQRHFVLVKLNVWTETCVGLVAWVLILTS